MAINYGLQKKTPPHHERPTPAAYQAVRASLSRLDTNNAIFGGNVNNTVAKSGFNHR